MSYTTHFMSPWKMIDLFQDVVTNVFAKKCELWVELPQDHDCKVSRPSAIVLINRTLLKFQDVVTNVFAKNVSYE